MKCFQTINSEVICSELTISKKKWLIFTVYRPPVFSNITEFFSELEQSVDLASAKYDNVIIMGDINIDFQICTDAGYNKLKQFCDIYNLSNLIKANTCFMNGHQSSIDIILTNRPNLFQHTAIFETGLSDYHKMISTSLKTHLVRLKPKIITYRCYKNFNHNDFLTDVQNANFICNTENADENYNELSNKFRRIVDKHAPIKRKTLRGNHAPFMNRELRKAIYNRSRLKNKLNKNPTTENKENYKKQRNVCVSLRNKAKTSYFKTVTKNGIINNKNFWNIVKPFITNKSGLVNTDVTIVQNNIVITDDNKLTELFNHHYVNIVEESSGIKPACLTDIEHKTDFDIISEILLRYKDHPSITEIKKNKMNDEIFSFHEVEQNEIKDIFHELVSKKSTGEDQIPPKLVKLSGKYLIKPVTEAINSSIRSSVFPQNAKRAAVIPLDKGGIDKTTLSNYRPVSILNIFSKIYEKIMKKQLTIFLDKHLSIFVSAYRKLYGTQHVLMRLLEEWRNKLDNDYVVGAVLMDLSKAFDSIPHDLLIAKLAAYGLDKTSLLYILSYLKDRKQATRINDIYSLYLLIISGVPQGSIIGPILFNLFMNDLFYFIKNANIHNYADDNTLTSFSNSIQNLINILESESNIAISWLRNNKMIANPDKFHSIIITKNRKDTANIDMRVGDQVIKTEQWVKLLGIKIDNKLNFDLHINDLCRAASGQLNALFRLNHFLDFNAKKVLIQSFIYANFNYCPLIWHFSSSKSLLKIESIQKRALRFLYNDRESNYTALLVKAGKTTMNIHRLKVLCTEIYKSINSLSPPYIKDIFQPNITNRPVRNKQQNNLKTPRPNQTTFGTNSLTSLGSKIWNSLPGHIKSSDNLVSFKKVIKNWDGEKCICNGCNKF